MQPLDWSIPFEIMCDTNVYKVGVVLGHMKDKKMHTIYYASRTLDEAQINYVTTENELLVRIFSIDKFCFYLVGSKIIIYIDDSFHDDKHFVLIQNRVLSMLTSSTTLHLKSYLHA